MLARTHHQLSITRRIARALTYLRGEARAAALDEVAAAIGRAERSVSVRCQTLRPRSAKTRTSPQQSPSTRNS
jgi:hypothetical protein